MKVEEVFRIILLIVALAIVIGIIWNLTRNSGEEDSEEVCADDLDCPGGLCHNGKCVECLFDTDCCGGACLSDGTCELPDVPLDPQDPPTDCPDIVPPPDLTDDFCSLTPGIMSNFRVEWPDDTSLQNDEMPSWYWTRTLYTWDDTVARPNGGYLVKYYAPGDLRPARILSAQMASGGAGGRSNLNKGLKILPFADYAAHPNGVEMWMMTNSFDYISNNLIDLNANDERVDDFVPICQSSAGCRDINGNNVGGLSLTGGQCTGIWPDSVDITGARGFSTEIIATNFITTPATYTITDGVNGVYLLEWDAIPGVDTYAYSLSVSGEVFTQRAGSVTSFNFTSWLTTKAISMTAHYGDTTEKTYASVTTGGWDDQNPAFPDGLARVARTDAFWKTRDTIEVMVVGFMSDCIADIHEGCIGYYATDDDNGAY